MLPNTHEMVSRRREAKTDMLCGLRAGETTPPRRAFLPHACWRRITIDGLPVYFPYDHMYKEQYEYMLELKRCLDVPVRAPRFGM